MLITFLSRCAPTLELIISFSFPAPLEKAQTSNTKKNAISKNFKKKKTISIIAGKCFLAPRLTLGSFLALGLPSSSKKKTRVSLCARKLIFLPMIVIAILSLPLHGLCLQCYLVTPMFKLIAVQLHVHNTHVLY